MNSKNEVYVPHAIRTWLGLLKSQDLVKSYEGDDKIPIGIFLVNPHVPTFEERYAGRLPNYLKVSPAREPIEVKWQVGDNHGEVQGAVQ